VAIQTGLTVLVKAYPDDLEKRPLNEYLSNYRAQMTMMSETKTD